MTAATRNKRAFVGKLDSDGSNYEQLIRQGLEYTNFAAQTPASPRIFLKPNLTFPEYRPGVMTSPAAVAAAIKVLRELGAKVWVGDSDSGGYNRFSMDEVYRETGIIDFASRFDVEVVNLSRLPDRESVPVRCGPTTRALELPRLLVKEIDLLVTMPVPKVHMNTGVSLTFKNQWGCIPENEDRLRLHPYFKQVVVDVNQAVKARFAIIDGRYGLNVSGPLRGQAVELDWVCVTDDIGAGATIGCELMRIPLEKIRHLKHASHLGLIPKLDSIDLNLPLVDFLGPSFYVRRAWTDIPGYLAFRSRALAHLAYFSRFSERLHKILYKFREPFY